MLEREAYASLITGALADGWLLTRLNDAAGGGRQPADLIGLTAAGRGVLVEVKMAGRPQPSPHQVAWLTTWAEHGGLALLVLVTDVSAEVQLWTDRYLRVQLTRDSHRRWRGWGKGGLE